MELNLSGVVGVRTSNRIFCARYCTCPAEPMRSAFFMLNPENTIAKGGFGHFKS